MLLLGPRNLHYIDFNLDVRLVGQDRLELGSKRRLDFSRLEEAKLDWDGCCLKQWVKPGVRTMSRSP